jgi:hypothetical protein
LIATVRFEACVERLVDLAHPAGAERSQDFVWTEARAGREGQRQRDYTGRTTGLEGLLENASVYNGAVRRMNRGDFNHDD